ncbi:MAG: hypothetical protein WAM18_04225, partial [Halobacillus sp.]|uniref:hypothetical protein n=1 Tax=Halobacillus sp. TaxID=56800 RepID=UPI003BB08BA0
MLLMIEVVGFLIFLSLFLLFQKKFGKIVMSYVSIGIAALFLLSFLFSGIDDSSRLIFVLGIVTMIGLV